MVPESQNAEPSALYVVKNKSTQKLRKKALETAQKLARLREANAQGYCRCVTCGVIRRWNEGMQGGHYIPKGNGGTNEWALDMRNIHAQCEDCNGFHMRYRNAPQKYTLWMIKKYGMELVELMNNRNAVKKHYGFELEQMIKEWQEEIKHHLIRIGD